MAHETTEPVSMKGIWYALLVFGLLTFGVGVFFIIDPNETLKVFTVIVGIFLLVDGVLAIIAAIVGVGESRTVMAIVGVLGVIAGLVLIKKPFGALNVFVLVLGIWFVVEGIARLTYAAVEPVGRGRSVLAALIDMAAGIVILSWPEPSLKTIGVIIGIVLVLRGIFLTYAAWKLLRLEGSDGPPVTPAIA